jgi:hypothetical protein
MRLERLGQLKYPMTSSGIEPATSRLVRSIVPHPIMLPRVHLLTERSNIKKGLSHSHILKATSDRIQTTQ